MTLHDLTHSIEAGMQVYPGDPPVELTPHATHADDGYRLTHLSMGTHTGTHVDAPSHTEPQGASLGAFPVGRFQVDAVRVDCRDLDEYAAITRDYLPESPPDADCLALWTGWDDHWGTDRYFAHPYLAPDAARWCAEHDYDVGIDALSPDPTPPPAGVDLDPPPDLPGGVPAHHALLGSGQLIVENLADLGTVEERFELRIAPLAIDADGAPVRAVGEVDE